MLPEFFSFQVKTRLLYSEGLVGRAGEELGFLGKRKALLVTDKIIIKTGLAGKLKEGLKGGQIEIAAEYDDVPPNSDLETVEKAAALGKEKGCDLIIALGGGSVMDTAKVANIIMTIGGSVRDHMGAQRVKQNLTPSVFIPTTAGTGSEVTQFAVVLDKQNNVKLPFSEEAILPDVAILDPEMTATMPGKLTAATGMDALTHAIEAYVSEEANPVTQALALNAVEMISANILQACAVPEDMQARGAMLAAAAIAGIAFSHSGVGIVHAVSHALGGVYHIPHGLANAIILPLGIEHNLGVASGQYARIAEVLGAPNISPVGQLSREATRLKLPVLNQAIDSLSFVDEWVTQKKAESLPERIREMNRKLKHITGFATDLREAGIKDNLKKIDEVVKTAMEDGSLLYNPAKAKPEDIRKIVQTAHDQNLPAYEMSDADFKAARLHTVKKRPKDVFEDSEQVYDVIIGFFKILKNHKEIGPALNKSDIIVRFNYTEPDSAVTIDASGDEVKLYKKGEDSHITPEIEMSMKADFAHYFWHGKANVVQALARREVVAKGNLPRAMNLLPILEPAYSLYPDYLKSKGLAKIVVE